MLTLKRLSADCRWPLVPASQLLRSLRTRWSSTCTRTCAWTPWSVFQDGSDGPPINSGTHGRTFPIAVITDVRGPNASRRSTRITWTRSCLRPCSNLVTGAAYCSKVTKRRPYHRNEREPDPHASAAHCMCIAVHTGAPHPTSRRIRIPCSPDAAQATKGSQSLGPQRLQAHLTLFPKCFPPFPHGTCSLLQSGGYSALGGTYLLHWRYRPRERDSMEQTRSQETCWKVWAFHPPCGIFPDTARQCARCVGS